MNLSNDQIIKANINGKTIQCRIIGLDSDPSALIWVVEVNNPDQDHYIACEDIV